MSTIFFFAILYLLTNSPKYGCALRLLRLGMPGGVVIGDPLVLTCSFDLENDQLYSVKWYKANREFYRYMPSETPPAQFFHLPGVYVDVSASNVSTLTLTRTDLDTEDVYECEVSAEAPSFQTIRAEKRLNVFVLPKTGPDIIGVKAQYHDGEMVNATCHAGLSKPAGKPQWFINGNPPSEEDEASELVFPVESKDGLQRSSLGLMFRTRKELFQGHQGSMKLKCTVTISDTYSLSSEKIVARIHHHHQPLHSSDSGDENSESDAYHIGRTSGDPDMERPVISGGQAHYRVGDMVNVNCSYFSRRSFNVPSHTQLHHQHHDTGGNHHHSRGGDRGSTSSDAAYLTGGGSPLYTIPSSSQTSQAVSLQWLLNEQPVPPSFTTDFPVVKLKERFPPRYKHTMGLHFIVRPIHFKDDQLTLKCVASVESSSSGGGGNSGGNPSSGGGQQRPVVGGQQTQGSHNNGYHHPSTTITHRTPLHARDKFNTNNNKHQNWFQGSTTSGHSNHKVAQFVKGSQPVNSAPGSSVFPQKLLTSVIVILTHLSFVFNSL